MAPKRTTLGKFWVDMTLSVLWVLLPMSVILALFLAAHGIPQTLLGAVHATGLEGAEQVIARGPAAAQIAIKQLGTNGGGFFGVNAAHPFENPTIASNMAQSLSIRLIPVAFCFLFGRMAGDRRQGWAIFAAMGLMFLGGLTVIHRYEVAGNPALGLGTSMEGKEQRFGAMLSALWAASTTAASNGSVNAMHDSFMPLPGLVMMVFMAVGEVIWGGVGAGLYGMLLHVVPAVFLAGTMVGRTPEYPGRKINGREVTLAVPGIAGSMVRKPRAEANSGTFPTLPIDGEVVRGMASVTESAITGESAPVIRESRGDRSSVTGGTTVVSDWLVMRVIAEPGKSFLDRMIALVEGAERQKTPNAIALNILLVGLTLIFLFVVVTLPAFASYSGTTIPVVVLGGLFVTLIPTTIGGLLSAIGIADKDRLAATLRLAERLGAELATLEADRAMAEVVGAVARASSCSFAAEKRFPVASLSVIYMTAVVVVASRRGRFPAILAAVLGFLADNLLFTHPRYSFNVTRQGAFPTPGLFRAASLVTGNLAARLRARVEAQSAIADRSNKLHDFSRRVASALRAVRPTRPTFRPKRATIWPRTSAKRMNVWTALCRTSWT